MRDTEKYHALERGQNLCNLQTRSSGCRFPDRLQSISHTSERCFSGNKKNVTSMFFCQEWHCKTAKACQVRLVINSADTQTYRKCHFWFTLINFYSVYKTNQDHRLNTHHSIFGVLYQLAKTEMFSSVCIAFEQVFTQKRFQKGIFQVLLTRLQFWKMLFVYSGNL